MRIFILLALGLIAFPLFSQAAEPVPGDTCTAAGASIFSNNAGAGNWLVCQNGAWKAILSHDSGGALTKLGNLSCAANETLKFNGTSWICATDATGSGGITALTGDVTGSGTGSVSATIANNAVTSAKILDGTVSNADLAGAITISKLSVPGGTGNFLRSDGTWAVPPSGADNLGNHIATQSIVSDTTNTDDLGATALRWKDGWFAGTVTAGTFSGSGASLTALNAANLGSGTIPAARMPALTGDVTMAAGATTTAIAASAVGAAEIADASVTLADLSATGTKSATTFLRGDNTWATPAGGGGGANCGANLHGQITGLTVTAANGWGCNVTVKITQCVNGTIKTFTGNDSSSCN